MASNDDLFNSGFILCPACGSRQKVTAGYCRACGAALDDLPPGYVVGGNWVIEELLGSGGMGKVYLARHKNLPRKFAVKILHNRFIGKRSLLKRFRAEALAASRLDHPNVIAIVDHGVDRSGLVYITMEYIRGKSLEALATERRPFPERRLVRIAIQVCRALEAAHGAGIVHRDLKPDNIMVDEQSDPPDAVKVLDFGLAKALDPAILDGMSQITVAGSTCGTPEYMSPEQAQGLSLDGRSDIYALGVVMYRVMVGRPPFVGANAITVASAHVTRPITPPKRLKPDLVISRAFEDTIMKCLEKDPARRFSSAMELRQHLESLLEGQGISSPSPVMRLTPVRKADHPPSPWDERPAIMTGGALSGDRARRLTPAADPSMGPGDDGDDEPTRRMAALDDSDAPTERMPEGELRRRMMAKANQTSRARRPAVPPVTAATRPAPQASGGRARESRRTRTARVVVTTTVVALVGLVAAALGYYMVVTTRAPRIVPLLGKASWSSSESGPWEALSSAGLDLTWPKVVRKEGGGEVRLDWPSGARGLLADDAVVTTDLLGNLELLSGGVQLRLAASHVPATIRVPAAGSTVEFLKRGRYRVQLEEPALLTVTNYDGLARIRSELGEIPVQPSTEVRYDRGKQPTYSIIE